MRTTIQRGGILVASLVFALAVGMASAHGDDEEEKEDQWDDHPLECVYKRSTDEICFIIWGVEFCRTRESSDMECETVE